MLIAAASLCWVTIAAAEDKHLTVIPPVPKTYHPKRTPWGEPDLRGTWPIDRLNFTPLHAQIRGDITSSPAQRAQQAKAP